MNNIIIVSPNCTADSAIDLANRLGIEHAHNHETVSYGDGFKIINWGCSRLKANIILNQPRAVRRSLNKIRTFELLSDKVRMPVVTLDKDEAVGWANQGRKVVCRSLIKGCKSRGITLSNSPNFIANLEGVKFYTRFIANCTEYRINIYKGQVLTVYRKDPCNGDFRFKIQNGDEADFQEVVQDMIDNVHEHIGLDMFGLDVLKSPKGKWFLLEVNSAPILFPITYKRLANKIKQDYM